MDPVIYICATPIGNLEDMTFRAVRVLKEEVEAIFCEDTRQSRKLLNHYEIDKKTYSLHSHSTDRSLNSAVKILQSGKSIAYVTDCGTPGISDPGSKLVAFAREHGFKSSPLPGASALTSIVSVSGFPGKNLIFGGFLSKKEGKRKNELAKLKEFKGLIVFYESPHRITKTIKAVSEVFPENNIIVARELTKMFEEIIEGKSTEIADNIDKLTVKGEFAICINNN